MQLTSNQHYRGLNRRFDRRAALLSRFGFKYRQVAQGLAAFTRVRFGREMNIAAPVLMHADNRTWQDILATNLYR